MKNTAIILAAGNGNRMKSEVKKQFIEIDNKPLLYYSLKAFEESMISNIVVVVGAGDIDYCEKNIINKYGFKKVTKVIEGGEERYLSVYHGLQSLNHCENVLIHDGARPLITTEIINHILSCMNFDKAIIVGVPVKDTIKQADKKSYVECTPNREHLWSIQTPQSFEFDLISKAYSYIIKKGIQNITDDAMVLEHYNREYPIKIIEGSYENIKVTTAEDLVIAETFLKKRKSV